MEIIAKTSTGFIITASTAEVDEILSAVIGKKPEKVDIGQKIPAIDYASSIRKIGALNENYQWTTLLNRIKEFNDYVDLLKDAVSSAAELKD